MHAAFHIVLAGFLLASPAAGAQNPQPGTQADTLPTPAPVDTGLVKPPTLPDTASTVDAPILVPVKVIGVRPSPNYSSRAISTATKTALPLRDIPQSVTVINREIIADQSMRGMAEVVRYVPGITMGQGEGNRDQPTIRGNSTTADFFVDGVLDDAQYFRDLYNVEQVEALKGSNAMIFGRGGGGGVINRAMKEAGWTPVRELMLQGGSYRNRRTTLDAGQGLTDRLAGRVNAIY